jgi:hypothetical protein
MTAALTYLSQIANELYERQMRRAALRINARRQLFPHHGA